MKKTKAINKPKQLSTKKDQTPLFISLICVISFIAFSPSLLNQIDIWDDYYYLNLNPYLKILSIENIKNIFTHPYLANYQPFTLITYTFEYSLFKFNPLPYHLTNILLNLLNSVLLYFFIRQLTKSNNIAFVTAILFGIHPLHVESVTWVSERKDVLYALFFILGMIFYLSFKEKKEKKYYYLTLAMFLFSCLSKAMAVTFSVILILLDYLKDKDFKLSSLYNKIPFFIISLIFGLIAIKVQKEGGAIGFTSNNVYTLSDRFFFANYSLFFYIYKMFLPFHLSGLYPYPVKSGAPLPLPYLISPFINAAFFFFIIYSIKRSKNIVFGCLFFLISIFPVLQILSVGAAIAADRYFYVASIGLFFLAGISFNTILENKKFVQYKSALIIFGILIILGLSYQTSERTKVWKNSGEFWGNVAEEFPKLELPYFNRGAYYYGIKNYDAALNDFSKAIECYPNYKEALQWRAEIYTNQTKYNQAKEDYLHLIRINTENADINTKLGEIFGRYLNNPDSAIIYLTKANQLQPKNFSIIDNIGISYAMKGKLELALQFFMQAQKLKPNDQNTLMNISITYKNMGNIKKAEEYHQYAVNAGRK